MSVSVEQTENGVRLIVRDGKYSRWFEVPATEMPELIYQLGKAANNNIDVWPICDH